MRIGSGGEQREKCLENGVAPRKPVTPRAIERRNASSERGLERRRVLPRDSVAAGRKAHRFQQRHVRLIRDILSFDAPEAAWRRAADRCVHLTCIVNRRRVEDVPCCVAKGPTEAGHYRVRIVACPAKAGHYPIQIVASPADPGHYRVRMVAGPVEGGHHPVGTGAPRADAGHNRVGASGTVRR